MLHMLAGKIIPQGSGRFQWTIGDFLSKVWRKTIGLHSPSFTFSDDEYHLDLSLSGEDGPIGLSCCKIVNRSLEETNVKLRMRTGYRGKIETHRGKMDNVVQEFAVNVWMTWSEFSQKRSDVLNNGRLTVFCELENTSVLQEKLPLKSESSEGVSDEEASTEEKSTDEEETSVSDSDEDELISKSESGTDEEETSVSDLEEGELISKNISADEGETYLFEEDVKIFKKLQRDFKNLLTTGEDSDVTIKVQGKEFPAHRSILRSRSPVFYSMFSHDKVEKHNGVVDIDDCDPVAFPVFLKYLYTGSTKRISNENVFSLYTASHIYGVEELKDACTIFMESNMSVATFCDTITFALLHNYKELVDISTLFFCGNASEIIKTAKWQTFLRENLTVGNKLFITLLSI